jgi:hypothetical protein
VVVLVVVWAVVVVVVLGTVVLGAVVVGPAVVVTAGAVVVVVGAPDALNSAATESEPVALCVAVGLAVELTEVPQASRLSLPVTV